MVTLGWKYLETRKSWKVTIFHLIHKHLRRQLKFRGDSTYLQPINPYIFLLRETQLSTNYSNNHLLFSVYELHTTFMTESVLTSGMTFLTLYLLFNLNSQSQI